MARIRVRSASWVFAAQVFGKIVAFPMGILLARALGPEGKGALSVLQLVTQFSMVIFGMGMSGAFLFLAGRRELSGCDALIVSSVFGIVTTAVLLAGYSVVGPHAVQGWLKLPSGMVLLAALLLVGPAVVNNLMYAVVFGSGSVRTATAVANISLMLQLLAYTALHVTGVLSFGAAVGVWGLSIVGEALATSMLGVRVRSASGTRTGARALFKRGFRYSLMMWVAGLVSQAALRVDMFLLSAFKGTWAVGIYSVAVTFAELLWFLPVALNSVMLPKVSGEGEAALDVTLRLQRVVWPLTVALGALVALGAWYAIPLLYGIDFGGATIPLLLLMPGAVSMALATMPSAYLSGMGLPAEWTKASIVNLGVNTALNIVLIPRCGATGAAIASTVSYSVAAAVMIRAFVLHTGVSVRDALMPSREDAQELAGAFKRILLRGGA